MKIKIDGADLQLVQGDITEETTDAVVNAANSGLRGGGGVDGAIHRAGGASIMEECRKIGRCPTGSAVATGAGKLKVKKVIHAVGPIYSGDKKKDGALLSGAYRKSLELAVENRLQSISFPSISTGAYGYPEKEAAAVALRTVIEFLKTDRSIRLVRFVLFGETTFRNYVEALAGITGDLKEET